MLCSFRKRKAKETKPQEDCRSKRAFWSFYVLFFQVLEFLYLLPVGSLQVLQFSHIASRRLEVRHYAFFQVLEFCIKAPVDIFAIFAILSSMSIFPSSGILDIAIFARSAIFAIISFYHIGNF